VLVGVGFNRVVVVVKRGGGWVESGGAKVVEVAATGVWVKRGGCGDS
jgi:hypothetical protein